MIATIITLKTELLKKIADSSKDCFNTIHVFSFKQTIAILAIIIIKDVNKVIAAVKTLISILHFYLQEVYELNMIHLYICSL